MSRNNENALASGPKLAFFTNAGVVGVGGRIVDVAGPDDSRSAQNLDVAAEGASVALIGSLGRIRSAFPGAMTRTRDGRGVVSHRGGVVTLSAGKVAGTNEYQVVGTAEINDLVVGLGLDPKGNTFTVGRASVAVRTGYDVKEGKPTRFTIERPVLEGVEFMGKPVPIKLRSENEIAERILNLQNAIEQEEDEEGASPYRLGTIVETINCEAYEPAAQDPYFDKFGAIRLGRFVVSEYQLIFTMVDIQLGCSTTGNIGAVAYSGPGPGQRI